MESSGGHRAGHQSAGQPGPGPRACRYSRAAAVMRAAAPGRPFQYVQVGRVHLATDVAFGDDGLPARHRHALAARAAGPAVPAGPPAERPCGGTRGRALVSRPARVATG